MTRLDALLREGAEISALAAEQRARETMPYVIRRTEYVIVKTTAKPVRRSKTRKPKAVPDSARDVMFYNAGRYAAGHRDPNAVNAHFKMIGTK